MGATKIVKMKPQVLAAFNKAKREGWKFTEHSSKNGGILTVSGFTATRGDETIPKRSSVAVLLKEMKYL